MKKMFRGDPMDSVLCGWGSCTMPSMHPDAPLCRRHLIKAWTIAENTIEGIREVYREEREQARRARQVADPKSKR